MAKLVRLQDIADHCGVSKMTVSLALRNSSRVSAERRQQILRAAAEMGYHRNPLAAAFNVEVRKGRAQHNLVPLAYVHDMPGDPEGHQRGVVMQQYFLGASNMARQLGYDLQPFWMAKPGMRQERFFDILFHRGIPGILFAPSAHVGQRIEADLSGFALVALGHSIEHPEMHRSTFDIHRQALATFEQCRLRGYRRIGLASTEVFERRHRNLLRACFLEFLHRHGSIEPELMLHYPGNDPQRARLEPWLRQVRPDVLVSTSGLEHGWLEDSGHRVPGDIGFVRLNNEILVMRTAGFFPHFTEIAAQAVELLARLVEANQRGPVTETKLILNSGLWWNEGKTLRAAPGPVPLHHG
jgi:LacI family transcriptional regulator